MTLPQAHPYTSILLDAPGSPVSRIPLARLGSYSDKRYGDFSITAADVKEWQTNLDKLPGGRALIDEDHLANKPSPHRRTEASGWITGIDLEGDQAYAKVEWTPKGEAAVREKRYLFTSPTYGPFTDEKGQTFPNTLTGAALTNKPFLDMPMVTLASTENVQRALEQDPAVALYALALDGALGEDIRALAGETRPATETTAQLLQAPAWKLLEHPSRRQELDRAVRTLAREQSVSYVDAFERFRASWDKGREARLGGGGEPETVAKVLERAGVETPEGGLRLLDRRDAEVQRTLDAGLTAVAAQTVNERGQVQLEPGFDVSHLLHDDEERERRWRRARELERTYVDREAFDRDDLVHLEGGVDLVQTLERPLAIAEARQAAQHTARELDQALDAAVEPARRAKALDAAIQELSGERARIAPTAGSTASPKRAGTRFVELSGGEMSRALELYDETDHRISLDECAARVSGAAPARPATPAPAAGDGRAQLHARILTHQLENGGSYLQALEALTGIEAAGPTDSPR